MLSKVTNDHLIAHVKGSFSVLICLPQVVTQLTSATSLKLSPPCFSDFVKFFQPLGLFPICLFFHPFSKRELAPKVCLLISSHGSLLLISTLSISTAKFNITKTELLSLPLKHLFLYEHHLIKWYHNDLANKSIYKSRSHP